MDISVAPLLRAPLCGANKSRNLYHQLVLCTNHKWKLQRCGYRSKPDSVAQCEFFSKHLEDAETRGGWIGVASFKFSNLFTQQRQSVWQQDGRSTLSNIISPCLCFSHLVVVDHKRFFQSNLIKRVTCSFRKTQQIPSSLILKLQLKSFELHQPSLLHIRCSRLYVKYILLSSRFKYVMLSWGLNF